MIFMGERRSGKTTALIREAERTDGIVICGYAVNHPRCMTFPEYERRLGRTPYQPVFVDEIMEVVSLLLKSRVRGASITVNEDSLHQPRSESRLIRLAPLNIPKERIEIL